MARGILAIEAVAIDKLSGPFRKAAQDFGKSAGKIGGESTQLAKLLKARTNESSLAIKQLSSAAKGGLALGAGVAAGAIAALGSAAAQGAKEALNFQAALSEVATISGLTAEENAKLGDQAKAMAVAFGSDQVAQVNGFYQAISAGAKDVTGTMISANKLAVGGVTDITTAISGLAKTTNAYAKEGLTASDATDIFFTTIKAGMTNASELSSQIGNVADTAAANGVGVTELFAAIGAASKTMGNAAKPITGLKAAISNIQKPTKDAQKEAKRLGVEFSASALRSKGLKGFLDSVTQSAGYNADTLAKLFGSTEALGTITALTANNSKSFNEVLGQMADRSGATDEAFQTITKTLDFQVKQYGALKQAALTALGEIITESPEARGVMEGINGAIAVTVNYLRSLKGETFASTEQMRELAAKGVAMVVRGFRAMVQAGSFVAKIYLGLRLGVLALRTAFSSFVADFSTEFGVLIRAMADKIPNFLLEQIGTSQEELKTLANNFGEVSREVEKTNRIELNEAVRELEQFDSKTQQVVDGLKGLENKIIQVGKAGLKVAPEAAAFGAEGETVSNLTNAKVPRDSGASEETSKALSQGEQAVSLLDEIKGKGKEIAKQFAGSVANAFVSIVTGAQSFGEAMKDLFSGLVKMIIQTVVQLLVLKAVMAAFSFFGLPFADGGMVPGIKGYASGGIVSGGVVGRDSVPAVLMPGEYVVNRSDVSTIRRGGTADLGPLGEVGQASRGLSADGTHLSLSLQTMAYPSSQAQAEAMLEKALIPALERLARRGRLRV